MRLPKISTSLFVLAIVSFWAASAYALVAPIATPSDAPTLHVVVLHDNSPDCVQDAFKLKAFFETNVEADALDFTMIPSNLANREGTLQTIAALDVKRNDAVLFCYSGVGQVALIEENQIKPVLFVWNEEKEAVDVIRRDELVAALKGKGARLNALFVDSCCNIVSGSMETVKESAASLFKSDAVSNLISLTDAHAVETSPVVKALFFNPAVSGLVDLNACEIGESAYSTDEYNGVGIEGWIQTFKALDRNISETGVAPTWRDFYVQSTTRIQELSLSASSIPQDAVQTPHAFALPKKSPSRAKVNPLTRVPAGSI